MVAGRPPQGSEGEPESPEHGGLAPACPPPPFRCYAPHPVAPAREPLLRNDLTSNFAARHVAGARVRLPHTIVRVHIHVCAAGAHRREK